MSQFHDLCLHRQTCRKFADNPVEHEKLVQCVETARLTPSGCNAQPWTFVVVESPDKVAEVAKCAMQLGGNPYAAGAKAFIVVVEEHATLLPHVASVLDSQCFAKGDLGAATAYLGLAADGLGLGVCQFGVFDREKIRQLLDIPADKPLVSLLGIGYPADPAIRDKNRKPLEEIVRFV